MQSFSLTIKRLAKDPDYPDYIRILNHLQSYSTTKVKVVKTIFESNFQNNGLHLHGLILISPTFFRKKLCILGYHVKMDQLKTDQDINRWTTYMLKHQYTKNLFKQITI